VLANIGTESSYCLWKCDRNSGCCCLLNGLPKRLGRLLYAELCPYLEDYGSVGGPWQLGIIIHDGSDGLMLPDTSKVVSYDQ